MMRFNIINIEYNSWNGFIIDLFNISFWVINERSLFRIGLSEDCFEVCILFCNLIDWDTTNTTTGLDNFKYKEGELVVCDGSTYQVTACCYELVGDTLHKYYHITCMDSTTKFSVKVHENELRYHD